MNKSAKGTYIIIFLVIEIRLSQVREILYEISSCQVIEMWRLWSQYRSREVRCGQKRVRLSQVLLLLGNKILMFLTKKTS